MTLHRHGWLVGWLVGWPSVFAVDGVPEKASSDKWHHLDVFHTCVMETLAGNKQTQSGQ